IAGSVRFIFVLYSPLRVCCGGGTARHACLVPALVLSGGDDAGSCECHLPHHKPEYSRSCLRIDIDAWDAERVHREPVVVHSRTLWRGRTGKYWFSPLVWQGDCRGGECVAVGASCSSFEPGNVCWNICDCPVPEAGTGGGIRVI